MSEFKIRTEYKVHDAYCNCGEELKEISDGWFDSAYICKECKSFYKLKLVKQRKDRLHLEAIDAAVDELRKGPKRTSKDIGVIIEHMNDMIASGDEFFGKIYKRMKRRNPHLFDDDGYIKI